MDVGGIRRGYDAVARAYADHFGDELDHKPFDRAWLDRFAALVAGGPVCELGCGPGRVAAYLHACGVDVVGTDISEGMLTEARGLHPSIEFRHEDMLHWGWGTVPSTASWPSPPSSTSAPSRWTRRSASAGACSCPAATCWSPPTSATGRSGWTSSSTVLCRWTSRSSSPTTSRRASRRTGLAVAELAVRDPYEEVEYPSRRAYILARG